VKTKQSQSLAGVIRERLASISRPGLQSE